MSGTEKQFWGVTYSLRSKCIIQKYFLITFVEIAIDIKKKKKSVTEMKHLSDSHMQKYQAQLGQWWAQANSNAIAEDNYKIKYIIFTEMRH